MTATIPPANDRLEVARWFDACLRERVLPYWCRTADPVHGGYRLSDRHDHLAARRWRWLRQPSSPTSPPQKYLVTQSRML
jgi:hypothetical protein